MMDFLYILAQRPRDNDTDWVKYIFGFVIFIIWIVSALASHISKKQQEERRRRVREQIGQGEVAPQRAREQVQPPRAAAHRPAPQRAAPRAAPARIAPPPLPKPRPAPRPARAVQPKQRRTVAKPPPMPESIPLATTAPVTATQITTGHAASRSRPSVATASAIGLWLNPRTLRQQFILTEILQPPIALREPPPHRS